MPEILTVKTGFGAGIGAVVGLTLGGPIGAGVGTIAGGVLAHVLTGKPSAGPRRGELTPQRKMVYVRAMESMKDPADLRSLADAFAGEGLHGEARLLRERANGRELPEEMQEKRKMAFRKAMTSDKPEAIEALALAFANKGSIITARCLQEHAAAVRAAHAAGETTQSQSTAMLTTWADKLSLALQHFGPSSNQARSAAANLIRARGIKATPANVQETITLAMSAIAPVDVAQPETAEAIAEEAAAEDAGTPETEPAEPVVDATAADAAPAEPGSGMDPPEAVLAPGAPDTGAPEPTVVGPPAPPVEPLVPVDPTAGAATTTDRAPPLEEDNAEDAAIAEATAEADEALPRMRVSP